MAVGLWRTYNILPDVHPMPAFFFWVLIGIGVVGINYYKKSYKTMYPVAILIMALIWAFVQTCFGGILLFANRLAENPYANYEAMTIAKSIVYAPLVVGFFVSITLVRMLSMMQGADPLHKEKPDNARDMAFKLKKRIEKAKGKVKKVRAIWSLTEIDYDNDKQPKKIPLTQRMQGINKALFEKPFEEEFTLNICTDASTGEKVSVGYLDMFLHFLILGPTGSGKTFSVIKPIAWQVIKYMVNKRKIGLTVVEPKGDLAEDIAGWCKKLKIPHVYINPLDKDSAKFNPLQGDPQVVAESTRTVLKKLFGKQEAFFAQVQETSARNTILLLKRLHGDNLDLHDVIQVLRDQEKLKTEVQNLERMAGSNDDLVQYFQKEILGSLKSEYQKFAMGLRMQLEDLLGNDMLRKVITGNSDINFDKHLAEGGILVVNTAMGPLGKLGDAFGTFVVMHLQNAVFRRPGNDHTRTPHVLIIDEAPRYINPDFERLLTIGRSFRCACIMAIQSLGQLQLEERTAFTNVVMSNCRNKVIFGGIEEEDARKFEREFGVVETGMIQPTYEYNLLLPPIFPKSYRTTKTNEPRFTYTQIKELPQFHFIYHLMIKGQLHIPGIGTGNPVNINEVKPQEENLKSLQTQQQEIKEIKDSAEPEEINANKETATCLYETPMEAEEDMENVIRFIKPQAPIKEKSADKNPKNPENAGSKSQEKLKESATDVQLFTKEEPEIKNDPWADLERF